VPFDLTEEFAAVYRMHPLIPDNWSFRAATALRAPRRQQRLLALAPHVRLSLRSTEGSLEMTLDKWVKKAERQ
jgi:hypothetical protein